MTASDPPRPDRRALLLGTSLGISSLGLPPAAAAASESAVASWTPTLTFSDVSTTGFTVTWDAV